MPEQMIRYAEYLALQHLDEDLLDELRRHLPLDWLVALAIDLEDCDYEHSLWDDTNAQALHDLLEHRFPNDDVARITRRDGRVIVLVNPDHREACAEAATLTAYIATGEHLDHALYQTALDEAVIERWQDYDVIDRIELLQAAGETDFAGIFADVPPPAVHRLLAENFF